MNPSDWWRGAFEYSAIGMALASTDDGRWLDVNRALCRFTGYSEPELLRMTFRDIVHPEDSDSHPALIEKLLAGQIRVFDMEKRYLHKDGHTLWGHLTASVAFDCWRSPLYLVLQIQDITEHKRVQEQLVHALKLETVGRLAGGIAHDFNNLLTIINGYSEIALTELSERHPVCDKLREIERAGARAASLTRQLLLFSRKQVSAPTSVNLNGIISELAKMLRRLIGEDVTLNLSLTAQQHVYADPVQLEQVVSNLALNARDAMPHGGSLAIETEDRGLHVLLTVRDTGTGMSEDVKAHLFEPFFTTKSVGKGTGLGLAVVHGVVQQCDGRVVVESQVGQGTTVKIYFPRMEHSESKTKTPVRLKALPGGRERVLLVEDEDDVRTLTNIVLNQCGYRVLEARSGLEALAIARECREVIDILVTDVVMPELGGRQLAERLAALHPETKTLYLSGYTDDAIVRYGISHDNMHFLQKPFSPAALAQKVRETIDAAAV